MSQDAIINGARYSLAERLINRNIFLDNIRERTGLDDKIYVMISPGYDIFESCLDLGKIIADSYVDNRSKVSRSPYRHEISEKLDVNHLCNEADGAGLIVCLVNLLCDKSTYKLSNDRFRHGHEAVEAAAVAGHLKKPLIVGYLAECRHSHAEDIHRFSTLAGNGLELFYIGGSLRSN